jgi:hypothetical protein
MKLKINFIKEPYKKTKNQPMPTLKTCDPIHEVGTNTI